MDLYGFFDTGKRLFTALVETGTSVYDIFFVPLKDSVVSFDLPFIGDLLSSIPSNVWETFLGNFSLVGLFISSGVMIYIILFLFNLLLKFIDILT